MSFFKPMENSEKVLKIKRLVERMQKELKF
jgi:hypothetical protein